MKYELFYWHAFFVRRGDYDRASTAIYAARTGCFPVYMAQLTALWRVKFATAQTAA